MASASPPTPDIKPAANAINNSLASLPNKYEINIKSLLEKRTDKPLNNYEVGLYKEIFKFQSKGDWAKANVFISKIDNPILLGHILIQRYSHSDYTPTLKNYQNWQNNFRDHPQSTRVDNILGTNQSTYVTRANGTLDELRYFSNGSRYLSEKYNGGERFEVNQVKKLVLDYLSDGKATAALNFFETHRVQAYIDPIDKAQILAEIASHYLYLNHPKQAKSTALKALKASNQAPLAGWVMGLVSWINNDMRAAAKYFTMANEAPYASPWMTSATAYWAYRAYTKSKDYKKISQMRARAMQHPRTFYGLLATKAEGYGFDFNWTMPKLSIKHKDVLLKHPTGARILALTQTGQLSLAEEELFSLPIKTDPILAEAALAVAHEYNLAGYAMRFSLSNANPAGGYYDSGLFPISSWTTDPKYTNQALLNAFIRQESRFRALARNSTGATGLMQVMPSTAAYITKNDIYKTTKGQVILANPRVNVDIGALYLNYLLELKNVKNDLFSLAMAYNAGPGNLSRWKREITTNDPLLFIELIPSSETRAFVERVLTNYWIYQLQMGNDPKTLLDVVEGRWPKLKK